ncbi:uncharacterized protein LOC117328120 isoform X2 [Pecten maximus]|uniref:uncharacterized protein LOC117328120 isoform X2 n=1 Tax=Pecten maximus TaxID=6579 RepID=UPI0014580300|nr:uncharacterized protein LOC117328120 isoform X2 [Pecten maximus]
MEDLNTTTLTTTEATTTDNINTTTSLTTSSSTDFINITTILTTDGTTPDSPSAVGAIAGGVVGGIIFLVIIAAVVFFILRRRRRKRKRRKEKLDSLQSPPSVNELENAEKSKHKKNWSMKDKPNKVSSPEPHYVNEEIGTLKTEKGKSGDPLYLQPAPPKRDLYSGVDGTEYYMGEPTKSTGEEPTEVYSDPNIPGQTNKESTGEEPTEVYSDPDIPGQTNKDTPKPVYTNSDAEKSVKNEPRDYENVPPKRTPPPKANAPKEEPCEVMDDEEQTVYENA